MRLNKRYRLYIHTVYSFMLLASYYFFLSFTFLLDGQILNVCNIIIILFKTIQVPGSSSLQELRRRRLGKLLMAKVVRKSQKSEATAEKNHQNQKVSMNEPFSKTGAQKLDILQ